MTVAREHHDNVVSLQDEGIEAVSDRLLASAAKLSRNAMEEIDWSQPMEPDKYGCSPEWSSLYGTDYWNELTEEQRISLTRHEFASIMCIGIWFEMILQELVLTDQYAGDYHSSEFQFALVEIADECRHSLMFAKATEKMVGKTYLPAKPVVRGGRYFRYAAKQEVAYAGILVAEEILDVFQRGCMRDDRVLPFIRTVNEIHVLEESRHMKFAREQVREAMVGVSARRRHASALLIAMGAYTIFWSLIRPQAYADAGLDRQRARREAAHNEHFHSMVRSSCVHLMEFLDEVGLLTRPGDAVVPQSPHDLSAMAFVITQSCCSDAACVAVCPVNCIHPTPEERGFGTSEILHVDPTACIDCGACADACPVDAIFPADRLGERDRIFIDINADYYADYYADNPGISSGWSGIEYPDLPRLPDGLRVAIVGTGPSGGYALRTLLDRTRARVTVLDRLPTPGGLVRAGVAPDHPSTKDVLRTFDLLYRDPHVTLATNVDVGDGEDQVRPDELAEHFDAVFYAVGASESRELGIPGEDLPGSMSAGDLVAWYNAVPGVLGPAIPVDGSGRAVIVGTGNVALDIARILVSPADLLATTDIADRALELLREQGIREVVLLGRRGQDSAAYTAAEYRALSVIPGVDVEVYRDADGPLPEFGPTDPERRRIVFLFHTGPVSANGDGRLESVTVRRGSGERVIPADLLVRSIGYRSSPIPGLPFDEVAGVFPNAGGRMTSPDGTVIPGVYVLGWAGRGASGGIGANKQHAIATVEAFIEDAAAGRIDRTDTDPEAFGRLLRDRRRGVLGYRGVTRIDRHERASGVRQGRPRVKLTEIADMLNVAARRR